LYIILYEDVEIIQIVMAICYEIWWSRNKRCFVGIEIPCAVRGCNKALKNVHNFNYAHNVLVQIMNHPTRML